MAYCDKFQRDSSPYQQCSSTKPSMSNSLIPYFKPTPSKLSNKSKRAKELTKGLMKLVVKDLRPLSIVEGEGFLEFMNIAVSEYIVPSKQTIIRLVEQTAQNEKNNLKCFLKNIPHICITVDFWTSLANHSYLGVTCHYLENWYLRTRVLETVEVPESHTSINIVNNLKSILKFWNIENKVCAIVSDNAANMVKAINDIDQTYLVRCTAHSIQLSINAGIQNNVVKEIINKLRKIVGHFNRSATAQKELEIEQEKCGEKKHKLVQDCVTRWNSTCDMIDKPFKIVTEVLGGENYTTASIAHRLIKSLLNTLKVSEQDSHFLIAIKKSILDDLKKRREMMGVILSKASALDPRFRELKFLSEEEKETVWKQLENELKELIPDPKIETEVQLNSDSILENEEDIETFETQHSPPRKKLRSLMIDSDDDDEENYSVTQSPAIIQLEEYRNFKIKISYDQDPLKWWKENEFKYSAVSLLAKKYLSIVATSVPCERLFSEAGTIISKKRNRLSPERLNQLLFLNSYFKSNPNSETLMEKLLEEGNS
ncbi:E3 SUMO-protein ligase ZBED1-like [Aphis gossypii]|uniref:E3 SUMO-protein ligase ZBED1-like n=1 Tax=Aphis gossypii TaxID=80765 RepID=UPI002158C693|nr:E3 SUMO-protein ligase ZBED1-like [Aphis gossypii]